MHNCLRVARKRRADRKAQTMRQVTKYFDV